MDADEDNKRADKLWNDFLQGKRVDPPDLRVFGHCVEVNKKWVGKLGGMTRGGHLHRLLRVVQKYFYKKSSFKVSTMVTKDSARQALLDFVADAPRIIANQDALRAEHGSGAAPGGGGGFGSDAPKKKRTRVSGMIATSASAYMSAAVAEAEASYLRKKTENEKIESEQRQVKTQVDILKGMGHSFTPEQLKAASDQLDSMLSLN